MPRCLLRLTRDTDLHLFLCNWDQAGNRFLMYHFLREENSAKLAKMARSCLGREVADNWKLACTSSALRVIDPQFSTVEA